MKLVGRTDLEDVLGRLDRLTQDEVRMAAAQGLKATHEVDNKVQSVDNRLQQVVDEIGDEKCLSSIASPHSSSTLTTHTGNQLRKDLGNWLLSPRSIYKLQHHKRCSPRRYRPMVHGKQRFQRLEGVRFINVDLRKTYVYFPPLLPFS
jgi:hypothetical protein